MNNGPLISIAIASYNYSDYILNALEAIKNQNFKDYEVVICDDSSTDDSVNVINKFINSNPDIEIKLSVNESNKGILVTKSRLIEMCSGKYIMFCDSDDWMADNCLEILSQYALYEDPDFIAGQVIDIDTDNNKVLQIQDFSKTPSKWLCTILHGVLFKREIIVTNDISFRVMPEDAYFILKFNMFSKKICFVEKPIYYWRVHTDSEGRDKRNVKYDWVIHHFNDILLFIDESIEDLQKDNLINKKRDDIEQIELLLLKLYYLLPLHALRFMKKNKFKCYFKLKKMLKKNHPNYLKNRYLKFGTQSPARPYATKIIRACAMFEKLHIFPVVLFGYYFIRKFVYFDE